MSLEGLIAATYTPMNADGSLRLEEVPRLVEFLLQSGVSGLYVCGSTGEGMSLAGQERKEVAAAFIRAAGGRVPVIIQVGHNSLFEARELAAHAASAGAHGISATAPSYYKVTSSPILVESMALIAEASGDLPFYYYHIPEMTGVDLDMTEFVSRSEQALPTLAGIKFTKPAVHEYQQLIEFAGDRLDILWGYDEMLLPALAVGCRGAIGSTYNIAAPLYLSIIDAFAKHESEKARRLQALAVKMVATIARWPFHPAMKQVLQMMGIDCGGCRLPLPRLSNSEAATLKRALEEIGFWEWSSSPDKLVDWC